MITESHIIPIELNYGEVIFFKHMGKKATEIHGKSFIYEGEEREEKRLGNNLTGQAGELSLHKYLFYPLGIAYKLYVKSRRKSHLNPKGDGGQDILDTNIDIKTSMMKTDNSQNFFTYNLVVNPGEFKDNWVYACGLIREPEVRNPKFKDKKVTVYLMGWAYSKEFRLRNAGERFEGNYAVKVSDLRPFPLPDRFPSHIKQYIKKEILYPIKIL